MQRVKELLAQRQVEAGLAGALLFVCLFCIGCVAQTPAGNEAEVTEVSAILPTQVSPAQH